MSEQPAEDRIQTEATMWPTPDVPHSDDKRSWLRGADVEMWMPGSSSPDRRFVRPSRIRVNGSELVFAEGSAPFVSVSDFGSKTHPVSMDLRGVLIRSLTVHPIDPSANKGAPDDFKVLDGLAPGAGKAAQAGIDIANNAIKEAGKDAARATQGLTITNNAAWEQRIADGLVKPGQHPKLPNMAAPRPSYWRRVWNAIRGR